MSDNTELPQQLQQYFHHLQQTIRQKNELITHLQSRMVNQQKQIDMLVMDAEEKHFHQITKYYARSYQKYMRFGKYLLIKVEGEEGGGIYLPKGVKIVHFGELEVYRGGGDHPSNTSININKQPNPNDPNNQNNPNSTPNPTPNQNKTSLKQLSLNKQQSNSFEQSCKGLSLEIQQLKQKLKAYTTMVSQKSASKIDHSRLREVDTVEKGNGREGGDGDGEGDRQGQSVNRFRLNQYSSSKKLSVDTGRRRDIGDNQQVSLPIPPQNAQNNDHIQQPGEDASEQSGNNLKPPQSRQNAVSPFPSPSPKKKKTKSKTIYFRKR